MGDVVVAVEKAKMWSRSNWRTTIMLASNEDAEVVSNRACKEFEFESGMDRFHDSTSVNTLRSLSNRRPRSDFDNSSPHEISMEYGGGGIGGR